MRGPFLRPRSAAQRWTAAPIRHSPQPTAPTPPPLDLEPRRAYPDLRWVLAVRFSYAPASTALTTDQWLGNLTELTSYLPITLGIGGNSLTISSAGAATDVLRRVYSICGQSRAPLEIAELAAQLLAAKANVARAPQFGENLSNARVYALPSTVSDAIITGDRNLILCSPTRTESALMLLYSRPLHDVNRRGTTHRW